MMEWAAYFLRGGRFTWKGPIHTFCVKFASNGLVIRYEFDANEEGLVKHNS